MLLSGLSFQKSRRFYFVGELDIFRFILIIKIYDKSLVISAKCGFPVKGS